MAIWMGRCLRTAPSNNSGMGMAPKIAEIRKGITILIFARMKQMRGLLASTQRAHVDRVVACKNQRLQVEVVKVWSCWGLLVQAAKRKCLPNPNNSWERDKRLLDGGEGAPQKVLEAYMGEVGWLAEPTRGQKAQPLHVFAQLGGMVKGCDTR